MEEEMMYKTSDSRRSIDWRDSGIVIDDDINFFDDFNKFYSQPSIQQQSEEQTTITPTPNTPKQQPSYQLPDCDGDTILHIAVVGFTIDKVKDLVQNCDLNAINNMMQTPLHVATMANRLEMVQLLIEAGAKIMINDRKGNTPLHLACQKGFKDIAAVILDLLEQNQQDLRKCIEMANFDGQTCLHLAAKNDQREIIALLVQHYNANINCHDSKAGSTIMHTSINDYNVDLIAFIASFEKHCNEPDFYGRRPLKTLRILMESSDDSKTQNLYVANRLINDRIELCIKKGGCCTEEQYKIDSNESLESSSSSSDEYSDSDS